MDQAGIFKINRAGLRLEAKDGAVAIHEFNLEGITILSGHLVKDWGATGHYLNTGNDPQLLLPPFDWNGDASITFIAEVELKSNLPEVIEWIDKIIKQNEKKNTFLENKLTHMHESFSWKATAPIRAIQRFFSMNNNDRA
jgi:hypothetical protein